MNKLIQSIYKAPIYQLGGQIDQPTPEEQEEFKMFIGDMIQSKQLNEQDVNEQNVPKLFQMYRQLKKQGKWKPKKMGMFQDGGVITNYDSKYNYRKVDGKWQATRKESPDKWFSLDKTPLAITRLESFTNNIDSNVNKDVINKAEMVNKVDVKEPIDQKKDNIDQDDIEANEEPIKEAAKGNSALPINEVENIVTNSHKWGLASKPVQIVKYADSNAKDLADRGVDIPDNMKDATTVLPEFIHYGDTEKDKVLNKYKNLNTGKVGVCTEKGCSERARTVLANTTGKDLDWAVKQGMVYTSGKNRNNAWDVEYNILNNGGKSIYSYKDAKGEGFSEEDFKDWNKYDIKVGDVVGLHNNEPTNNPVSSGRSTNKSRHVGVVVGFNKDGIPMVRHNIHGKEYLEPINNITEGVNKFASYYVHYIARPKDLVDSPINVDEYDRTIKGYKFDTEFDPSYTKIEKDFLKGINEAKEGVMRTTGMSEEDYIKYGQMAFGILQMESEGGRDSKYYLKAKQIGSNMRKRFTGEESSKGWTQLKYYPEKQGNKLGVSNLLNPKESAIATILNLHEKNQRLLKHSDYKDKDTDYYLAGSHKNDLGFKLHAVGKSSGLLNYRNKSYDADNYNLDYANKVMEASKRLSGYGVNRLWDKYKQPIESREKYKPMFVDKGFITKKFTPKYNSLLGFDEAPAGFKKGGKLSAYIPHGVMHRFEHKSGDVIKAKFGIEVTKKGIPVLSKDCNTGTCRYNQTAEVEKGEVIFDKPLMDKITAYRNRPDKAGELIYNALINLEGDTSRHEIKSR